MILTLKRTNILDIKLAIQLVILDFQAAIKNPETREERKETARRSIENRWLPLLENIKEQFEKQDEGSQSLDFEKIPGGEDMDVLQVLYSLWTSNRELTSKDADERERQAFDAGFKTAMQLCRQLEDMGEITE